MQLRRVKISNVLSFPHQENFATFEGVIFDTGEKAVTNTLIWPNGSGKSNFLSIVSQVLKAGLFIDYIYNKEILAMQDSWLFSKAITTNQVRLDHVTKHFLYPNKKSMVSMDIVFNRNDYENLLFLCKYRTQINDIIAKYSTLRIQFPEVVYDSLLFYNTLPLVFTIDVQHQKVTLRPQKFTPQQDFLLLYLQHIELIQICMSIYNDYERNSSDRKWYPLKNTFALLSAQRGVAAASLIKDISVMNMDTKSILLWKDTSKADPSIWYKLCLSKIMHTIQYAQQDCHDAIDVCVQRTMDSTPFIRDLNITIRTYLGFSLRVIFDEWLFYFSLVDRSGQPYEFNMLSSGEQSFLLIIMTIYGYDMENGLMIVDEPELHLHPQMQKSFIDMIDEMSEKLKMQFIIATHSPIMINEKNVWHVYRCSKVNHGTSIKNPPYRNIWTDEANLIHMLKFGNVAKIFFVDTIVMVEWETDAYFFDFYLQYIKSQVDRWYKITNYEFININGKGSYRKWEKFLHKFGVSTSFIGDWDNVLDRWIVNKEEFARTVQTMHRAHHIKKTERYGKLVTTLADSFPDKYKIIQDRIASLYDKHVFILQKGDLETYLGLPVKWLDETVSFCQKHFDSWMANPRYDDFRNELNGIFERIFSSAS